MIAALIPAAGSSSRLGRPKLLLKFDGQPLIGRLVRALRDGGAARVVVVAPPADVAEGPAIANEARLAGAEVVVPLGRPAEMRDSIELGLKWLEQNGPPECVLLTPGDCPGVTPGIVTQLVSCGAAERPDRIVIPTHDGRRGHPIVLPWPIAAEIHSLPAGVGVNALVARHAGSIVELEIANPEIVADLDTPADLKRWEQTQIIGNPSRQYPQIRVPDSSFKSADLGGSGVMAGFRIQVRLFALAKDRAGRSELEIELLPGSTVADLRTALCERMPALGPLLSRAMIAVDEEYAGDDVRVAPGSRLAVIPPVSGGAGMKGLIR